MAVTGPDMAVNRFLVRLLNHEFEQAVINGSLGIVCAAIAIAVILSIIFPPPKKYVEEIEEKFEGE